jgi:hypothetical protein
MTLEEMEKRLTALEDLEEIKKLQREYMQHIDHLEFSQLLDLFTDDAIAETRNYGPHTGKKEIADLYQNKLGRRKIRDGHLVGEPVITVDGNRAKGHWTVYMFFSEPTVEWVQGRNDCEYIKVNGKWKFSHLKFTRTLASKTSLYP